MSPGRHSPSLRWLHGFKKIYSFRSWFRSSHVWMDLYNHFHVHLYSREGLSGDKIKSAFFYFQTDPHNWFYFFSVLAEIIHHTWVEARQDWQETNQMYRLPTVSFTAEGTPPSYCQHEMLFRMALHSGGPRSNRLTLWSPNCTLHGIGSGAGSWSPLSESKRSHGQNWFGLQAMLHQHNAFRWCLWYHWRLFGGVHQKSCETLSPVPQHFRQECRLSLHWRQSSLCGFSLQGEIWDSSNRR